MFRDIREFADFLEKQGQLKRVRTEIDPKHEIGAICYEISERKGPAVMFENVRGARSPVLVNAFGTRKRIALALETAEKDLVKEYLHRKKEEWPKPKQVKTGPCKEVILGGADVNLKRLIPQIIWNEDDAGTYITAGALVTKDPETGIQNMAFRRIMIQDEKRAIINMPEFSHAGIHLEEAGKRRVPLDAAIVVGTDPSISIASSSKIGFEEDHLAFAGSLRGRSVEVVKCETLDLEVPAYSEYVLEGRILPGILAPEAPFGDAWGYYATRSDKPVFEVHAITHRKQPIYQGIYTRGPAPNEAHILWCLPGTAFILQELKKQIPEVVDISYMGALALSVVSVKQTRKNMAEEVIKVLWSLPFPALCVKYLIVVDDDIDVHDTEQVLWAVATRSQPNEDLTIISESRGHPLDPSQKVQGITSKLGLDATIPFGEPFSRVAAPPKNVLEQIRSSWKELFPHSI